MTSEFLLARRRVYFCYYKLELVDQEVYKENFLTTSKPWNLPPNPLTNVLKNQIIGKKSKSEKEMKGKRKKKKKLENRWEIKENKKVKPKWKEIKNLKRDWRYVPTNKGFNGFSYHG